MNILNISYLLNSKNRYRRKLFLSFFFVVLVFFSLIGILQHIRERNFKIEKLEYVLDNYAEEIKSLIDSNSQLDNVLPNCSFATKIICAGPNCHRTFCLIRAV